MSCVRVYLALAAIGASALTSVSAFAQEAGTDLADVRGQSVMERARPGYDPVGVHVGSFMVFPQARIKESYDDNIYAASTGEKDDFITTLGASVSANSTWSRHALSLSGSVSQALYSDHSDENRLDWNVGGTGRLDITGQTSLDASARYARLHEDRSDPNSPLTANEPVEYDLFNATATFNQRFNRLGFEIGGEFRDYDYKNATSNTGTFILQDNRDRKEYLERARVAYFVSPDTNVFVEGNIDQRRYDNVYTLDRDSDGWAALVGSEFKLTRLAQGEVYVGYQERDYKASTLGSTQGLTYGANIDWFVTPLTTVKLTADSRVEETTVGTASGYDNQRVALGVDHELLRNLILRGRVSFANNDFNDNPRNDDIIGAGASVLYLLNRNFDVGLAYDYTNRDSNVTGFDYTRNIVALTLTGKL